MINIVSSVYFHCTNENSNVTSHNATIAPQWSEEAVTQLTQLSSMH